MMVVDNRGSDFGVYPNLRQNRCLPKKYVCEHMRGVSIAARQNRRASGQDRKRTGHQAVITLTFLGYPIFTHSRKKMSWYGPRSFNSSTPWMCLFSFLLRLTLEAISHFFSGDPSFITLVHPPVLIFYEGRQKTHTSLYHPRFRETKFYPELGVDMIWVWGQI